MKIFLSVGATYNDEQEEFVQAFEMFLSQNNCERLTVGRGSYFSSQPINSARDLMKDADGVVVIAFTRQIVESAIDKPNSPGESKLVMEKIPTIWNQLEPAMAFGLDLPLLMIIERGLKQEAMLKDRMEYRALVTEITPQFFQSDEFKGTFSHWKDKALERKKEKYVDINALTVGQILKALKPNQMYKFLAVVAGAVVSVSAATYWFVQNILNKGS